VIKVTNFLPVLLTYCPSSLAFTLVNFNISFVKNAEFSRRIKLGELKVCNIIILFKKALTQGRLTGLKHVSAVYVGRSSVTVGNWKQSVTRWLLNVEILL